MTAQRRYLSDVVFERVGALILRGEIPPGAALPSEQALSEELSVSKILVRQGIHRLAEADLVSVRQGEKTRAKDPLRSASVAVIALYYRLAPELPLSDDLVLAVLEKQYTQGLAILEVFARRASRATKAELVESVATREKSARTEVGMAALEQAFWSFMAEASGNRILAAETRYWYETLAERPKPLHAAPLTHRFAFYAELARRVAEDDNPLSYYIAQLAPLLRPSAPKKHVNGRGHAKKELQS